MEVGEVVSDVVDDDDDDDDDEDDDELDDDDDEDSDDDRLLLDSIDEVRMVDEVTEVGGVLGPPTPPARRSDELGDELPAWVSWAPN